jgi:ribonuclease BN (tRNA processing enzyme)
LPSAAFCPGPVSVQVLGSGGPIANNSRASSGYLLWIDGSARLLVDAGGGSFARFGNSDAAITDLDAIALTHFHADHSVELPAYLKSAWFTSRERPLPIVGPSGNKAFPGLSLFMQRLIGEDSGAFQYLSGYLTGNEGFFETPLYETDADGREPREILKNPYFSLYAVGVAHGPVPALGYLVEAGGNRIAFSGDQNGNNPAFGKMIAGADLLVMDHAIPEDADRVAANLHARPSEIARLASRAKVRHLLLSHLMPRSERVLEQSLTLIGRQFDGHLTVAQDLMCIELPAGAD